MTHQDIIAYLCQLQPHQVVHSITTKSIISEIVRRMGEEALELSAEDLELAGTIPDDETVYEYDLDGRPTVEMPEDSSAVKAAFEIFEKIVA